MPRVGGGKLKAKRIKGAGRNKRKKLEGYDVTTITGDFFLSYRHVVGENYYLLSFSLVPGHYRFAQAYFCFNVKYSNFCYIISGPKIS